jgi:predicted enzyme related to lactoylglutathione lyase
MDANVSAKIKGIAPLFLVADIELAITFYTRNLGFVVSFRYEDFYCGIIRDGFSIHLKSGIAAIEERENRKINEHVDITFSVEGIETFYEDIQGKQVAILQPLRDMPYGREFYIIDPDGYIIAFVE